MSRCGAPRAPSGFDDPMQSGGPHARFRKHPHADPLRAGTHERANDPMSAPAPLPASAKEDQTPGAGPTEETEGCPHAPRRGRTTSRRLIHTSAPKANSANFGF